MRGRSSLIVLGAAAVIGGCTADAATGPAPRSEPSPQVLRDYAALNARVAADIEGYLNRLGERGATERRRQLVTLRDELRRRAADAEAGIAAPTSARTNSYSYELGQEATDSRGPGRRRGDLHRWDLHRRERNI